MAQYTVDQIINRIQQFEEAGNSQNANALRAKLQERMSGIQPQAIDSDTGAPFGVRAAMSTAMSPQDRLATVQNYYPEAMAYGDDNFLAYNRSNNQPFLLNPEGFDVGDLAGGLRMTANIAGGIGGTVAASPSAVATGPIGPLAGGAAGATAAGVLYDKAMQNFMDVEDSRTAGEQLFDYGVETAMNMIPIEKIGGPLKAMFRTGNEAVRDVVAKYGIRPTAGTIGNTFIKSIEGATQRLGVAASAFEKSAANMFDDIARVVEDLQVSLGGAIEPIDSGRMVIDRGQGFIDNWSNQRDELYAAVDDYIPTDTQLIPQNLIGMVDEMAASDYLGEMFESSLIKKLRANEEFGEPVSYETIKNLRSQLGAQIRGKESVGGMDIDLAGKQRLYDALTRDMLDAAEAQGDEAVAAWNAANDFNASGKRIMEQVIYPLMTDQKGKSWVSPEEAFRRLQKLAKNDPDTLKRLIDDGVLSPADMNQVGAGMLNDLGSATARGQNAEGTALSPSRILGQTDQGVFHQEARDVLFNKTANEIVDDLRVIAAEVRDTENFVNRSGTGNTNAVNSLLLGTGVSLQSAMQGDMFTAGGALLGSVVLPYVTSAGIQSKPFVNWLKSGTQKGISQEWWKVGARIAADEGLTNVYQGIRTSMEGASYDKSQGSGVLEE